MINCAHECLEGGAASRSMGKQISELSEMLETRKLVGRAKGFLMDSQGMKEQEAFRKIQQLAMNTVSLCARWRRRSC